MCGITGIFDTRSEGTIDSRVLASMTEKLAHRGPDDCRYFVHKNVGLGFRRLSLVDIQGGAQPVANETADIVSICNGEIYNYEELKAQLQARGHILKSWNDCEILPHLYEEHGISMVQRLNGQFAFTVCDLNSNRLYLARDHFGVNPLFYAFVDGVLIFASEVKAILEHPSVSREIDLIGLDQVLCFPGVVSPRTMFKGIQSLRPGCWLSIDAYGPAVTEYWDVDYPRLEESHDGKPEKYYLEQLTERLLQSTRLRLRTDITAGVYLSGGLDSSLVASLAVHATPNEPRQTFSISFPGQEMCEGKYQRKMVSRLSCIHHEVPFAFEEISEQLATAVYHAESPLKETHDVACLALSRQARMNGVPVILTGQGADELFAGYIGYRFDKFYSSNPRHRDSLPAREAELRTQLWGDPAFIYDNNYSELEQLRASLYSEAVNRALAGNNALSHSPVNLERLQGRHIVHKRSYLDFKMRLADHLLADHGDRMAMAHSIELRHPFLDVNVVECAVRMPPDLKLKGFTEKYILKEAARQFVDPEIVKREKFGWYAPASPALLHTQKEWMAELLSFERIKNDGYFNPQAIERLKKQYSAKDFKLSQPFESDLLTIVLTFNIFLDAFHMPRLN